MRRNRIILILLIIIALVVGWQIKTALQHRGKVSLNVIVLPPDSKLTVDGVQTKAGKVYVKPGSHKLIASRQYFDDDIEIINTADTPPGQTIYLLPAANSAAAKSYLLQHPDIQIQREAAGGVEAERTRAALLKKYPIINSLPHETADYKIDYSISSDQKLSLTITTFGIINGPSDYPRYVQQTHKYHQEALDYLKQKGVQPTTYPTISVPNL